MKILSLLYYVLKPKKTIMIKILLIASDNKNNKNVALKAEKMKCPFPLTIYEANICCILNGFCKFINYIKFCSIFL